MRVFLIINSDTDVVQTSRVFATQELAQAALDATASWVAGLEEIRKQFQVIPVDVEGILGDPAIPTREQIAAAWKEEETKMTAPKKIMKTFRLTMTFTTSDPFLTKGTLESMFESLMQSGLQGDQDDYPDGDLNDLAEYIEGKTYVDADELDANGEVIE